LPEVMLTTSDDIKRGSRRHNLFLGA